MANEMDQRRALLAAAALSPFAVALPQLAQAAADDTAAAFAALRHGGAVLALRHALAPGVWDPPGFRLGDCGTQRLLSDAGRAQARRLGDVMRAQRLQPARVRSSPWCRCIDTAMLAFGRAEAWPALGGNAGSTDAGNTDAQRELHRALAAVTAAGDTQPGRFEAWVTHQIVLSALAGGALASAEGLVLRSGADGSVQVVGRIDPA